MGAQYLFPFKITSHCYPNINSILSKCSFIIVYRRTKYFSQYQIILYRIPPLKKYIFCRQYIYASHYYWHVTPRLPQFNCQSLLMACHSKSGIPNKSIYFIIVKFNSIKTTQFLRNYSFVQTISLLVYYIYKQDGCIPNNQLNFSIKIT